MDHLSNPWVKEEIKVETAWQNLWYATKAVLN